MRDLPCSYTHRVNTCRHCYPGSPEYPVRFSEGIQWQASLVFDHLADCVVVTNEATSMFTCVTTCIPHQGNASTQNPHGFSSLLCFRLNGQFAGLDFHQLVMIYIVCTLSRRTKNRDNRRIGLKALVILPPHFHGEPYSFLTVE
jgi:hypothetical protein